MTRTTTAVLLLSTTLCASAARANGLGENVPWQFESANEIAARAAVADLIEKKRNGYYGPSVNNAYNNTYINHQTNCSVSSSALGNSGSNGVSASTSSPTITNGATSSALTTGNSTSNLLGGGNPVQVAGLTDASTTGNWATGGSAGSSGYIGTSQGNAGSQLGSGVYGSSNTSSSGAVGAGGGTTSSAINSTQSNGAAQTSTISGSAACTGVGPLN